MTIRRVTDAWGIAGTIAVAASAAVSAAMAVYTRSLAQRTREMAALTKAEVAAVVRQGAAIEQQATASTEQVRLAQSALVAQVQPWLTLGEVTAVSRPRVVIDRVFRDGIPSLVVNADDSRLQVSLALRNVGNGLALIDSTRSHATGWSGAQSGDVLKPFSRPTVPRPVLPQGDQVRVEFDVHFDPWQSSLRTFAHLDRNYGEFALDIVYSDVLGERSTRLRVSVAGTSENTWVVHKLDYFPAVDAVEPTVSVRIG